MPSEERLADILAGSHTQANRDSFKIDEFGFSTPEQFHAEQIAKAFGPEASFDPELKKVIGGWTDDSMITRILTGGLLERVPFRGSEEFLIQSFSMNQPVVNWVTKALNSWTMYQGGLEASIGSYLERVKNYTRGISRPTLLDLPTIHRSISRSELGMSTPQTWPEEINEQLRFLGYSNNLQKYALEAFDVWPDLNTILAWEFRHGEKFRTSTDLPAGFSQPEGWTETTYDGLKNRLVKAQGIPSWSWELYKEGSQNPLDPTTAKAIYLRNRESTSLPPDVPPDTPLEGSAPGGNVWSEWYERVLYRNRYQTADIMAVRELDWMIPPANDLITMAVREVFSPDQAKALSLFEELPQEFVDWGKKQGLSEYWSKNYWGAHWQLPSPQMGFEMFQRAVITDEELKGLLKALDIAPVWRDKLLDINYNVITRVDARRMHKLGVLDEIQLLRVYQDQGFSPSDAQNMVDFTIKFNAEEERDLTKGELLRIFKDGVISERDLRQGLIDLTYSDYAVGLLIQKAQFDLENQKKELTKSEVRRLFKFETITAYEARERLEAMDLTAEGISLLMEQWTLERDEAQQGEERKPKKLTRFEATAFLTQGIIDAEEWNSQMKKIGYSSEQIDWFNIQWMMSMEGNEDA